MIGSLLSLIPSIIGLFSSNDAHDDYTKQLEQIKANQKLSQSSLQAKSLLAENATRGLAGYETIKEDINNQLPTTLNESKDWLSGSGAVDFLARSKASTDQQLRQLNAANEAEKNKNMDIYTQYLGGTMANREYQLQQDQSQLDVAAGYNNVDKAAVQTKTMGGVGNMLAGIADEELYKLIAGLSGSQPSLDMTTGQNYGIKAGPTSTQPAVDTGTAMFPNYTQSPITLNNFDKSQLRGLNLTNPDNPAVGTGPGLNNDTLLATLIKLMVNQNNYKANPY